MERLHTIPKLNGHNNFSKFKTVVDINNAETIEIENTIKCAGMAKAKVLTVKTIANYISNMYDCDLNKMLCKNYNDIRNELLEIKGVGPKSADVFLMVTKNVPIIPIDIHIYRILRRLGLVRNNASYEDARSVLENLIHPDDRKLAHILLIKFGR